MRLPHALLLAAAMMPTAVAQTTVPTGHPDSRATLEFIHAAWSALTRSMGSCPSLVDTKVASRTILYLPAEFPEPGSIEEVTRLCNVEVKRLPRRIEKLADVMPQELPAEGLLYLPHPYVVPGGRFNEMYGWDSYFIILGLEIDGKTELAKGMVENFLFEVEHYGGVLNANRTYYLTRSQPPFLSSMIRLVLENPASFADTDAGRAEKHAWLADAYTLATRDYSLWIRPEHLAGDTGLARYFDFGEGPVPEMADDATYYTDVIRWVVAHPDADVDHYLVKASEHPDAAETERLKETSCDITISTVCRRAWAEGYRLSKEFYRGDRAMRESGYDPSNRFGPFSGSTHHYAPVCLNSLLYRYERDMEHFAQELGKADDAAMWAKRAEARNAAIHKYLWRPKEGVFADYNFVAGKPSSYLYVTSLYPMWGGVATKEEAQHMRGKLGIYERAGGLSMSDTHSGLQWDEPFGWAPANWLVVAGLKDYGYDADAKRISRRFMATVDAGFAEDGTMREKYNVVSRNANVQVSSGYKQNVIGFGWTNAVYLKMKQLVGDARE
jgi:alpha,alpha-trehalase